METYNILNIELFIHDRYIKYCVQKRRKDSVRSGSRNGEPTAAYRETVGGFAETQTFYRHALEAHAWW